MNIRQGIFCLLDRIREFSRIIGSVRNNSTFNNKLLLKTWIFHILTLFSAFWLFNFFFKINDISIFCPFWFPRSALIVVIEFWDINGIISILWAWQWWTWRVLTNSYCVRFPLNYHTSLIHTLPMFFLPGLCSQILGQSWGPEGNDQRRAAHLRSDVHPAGPQQEWGRGYRAQGRRRREIHQGGWIPQLLRGRVPTQTNGLYRGLWFQHKLPGYRGVSSSNTDYRVIEGSLVPTQTTGLYRGL